MNILPKKRWHVRTKDNIERVRRDEAKAAEDEKERQRRIQLAEQESRTSFLRNQAQKRKLVDNPNSETSTALEVVKPEHVNFFKANQDGQQSWGTNKEHEEEKKQEKEKLEQSIGILTYLGQGAGDKPWYTEPPAKRHKGATDETEEVALKSKRFLDPLKDLKKYTDAKSKKSAIEPPKKSSSVAGSVNIPDSYKLAKMSLEKERNKHKKRKSSKKKHKKHKDKSKISSHKSSTVSIEQLRAARLARETEEKKRSELLLAKMRGEVTEVKPPSPVQDGKQRYNSQFNPHIAKQSKADE